MISPSSVASICPNNKSEKWCEYTNLGPLLHGMRWAIVALITFLVVAAFNPDSSLLNPSPKLGSICASGIAFVEVSSLLQFDALECWFFSSSTCFILFITACPICGVFCCLLLVLIYLYTMWCRKPVMHLKFVYCCCNLKCKILQCCEHWCTDTPLVFWGN